MRKEMVLLEEDYDLCIDELHYAWGYDHGFDPATQRHFMGSAAVMYDNWRQLWLSSAVAMPGTRHLLGSEDFVGEVLT